MVFVQYRGRVASNSAPTLADVAAHAGVSLATASRALNGSVRRVNPELTQRVVDSAAALGYSVNAQAQAVARGSGNTVALVVGDIADPYFAAIAAGVIEVARAHGLVVTIASSESADEAVESATLAALRAQRPRALLLAASRNAGVSWDALRGLDGLVVIGTEVPGLPSVVVDNFGGAADLAEALRSRGYSDFVVLAGPHKLETVKGRVSGFVSEAPDAVVIHGDFTRDGGYRSMAGLLAEGRAPECVFAVTDVMALGAMSAIRHAGLTPGIDIGVAGFDDLAVLQDVVPALTSVALPLKRIGASALELAIAGAGSAVIAPRYRGEVRLRDSTPGPVR